MSPTFSALAICISCILFDGAPIKASMSLFQQHFYMLNSFVYNYLLLYLLLFNNFFLFDSSTLVFLAFFAHTHPRFYFCITPGILCSVRLHEALAPHKQTLFVCCMFLFIEWRVAVMMTVSFCIQSCNDLFLPIHLPMLVAVAVVCFKTIAQHNK